MVQYVLNAGANPNRPDPLFNSAGVLPLSRAIEILCNVVDKAIFNRGLESTLANAKEDIDLISLSNAAIIIRRLGEHGADPDLRLGESIETPAMLLEYKLENKQRRAVLEETGYSIVLVKPTPKSAAQGFRDANPRRVRQQPQLGNNSTD